MRPGYRRGMRGEGTWKDQTASHCKRLSRSSTPPRQRAVPPAGPLQFSRSSDFGPSTLAMAARASGASSRNWALNLATTGKSSFGKSRDGRPRLAATTSAAATAASASGLSRYFAPAAAFNVVRRRSALGAARNSDTQSSAPSFPKLSCDQVPATDVHGKSTVAMTPARILLRLVIDDSFTGKAFPIPRSARLGGRHQTPGKSPNSRPRSPSTASDRKRTAPRRQAPAADTPP